MDIELVDVGFLRRLLGAPRSSPVYHAQLYSGNRRSCTSYLHNCNQGRQIKIAYRADRMQVLGLGAAMGENLMPLGQSLAGVDEPFECSPAFSQLQASAQDIVRQPVDSHLRHCLMCVKIMLGWIST